MFKIGDIVKVKRYCTDALKECFGEAGDGDYWSDSESRKQAKYVNMIGTVTDQVVVNNVQFCIVEFEDNICFTFDSLSLEVSDELPTTVELLQSSKKRPSRPLNEEELEMAKDLFIKGIIKKGITEQDTSDVREMAVLSCRAALIFSLSQTGKWYTDILEE
mgnify:CR=1 FL=1